MRVDCVPLTSFVHDSLSVTEGKAFSIDESTAKDLERAGLIRIRMAPVKTKKVPEGKGSDDGLGQPSSASQAAQVSSQRISRQFADGKSKMAKGGRL